MGLELVTSGKNLPEEINVVIEIPKDSEPVKYEVDKASGAIFVDRILSTPMRYPCNYGYVPNTLCGDGDPADVLVVLPLPLVPGSVVRCRPVGVLRMSDEAGSDEDEDADLDYLLTVQTYDWEDDTAAPAYAGGLTDAQPPFGPQNAVAAAEAAEEEERAQMTALERVRSMGESTGLVMSMGAFALLLMATGSLFMVRAIRQHQRNNPPRY